MMKKLFAITIIGIMMLLAACSNNNPTPANNGVTSDNDTSHEIPTLAENDIANDNGVNINEQLNGTWRDESGVIIYYFSGNELTVALYFDGEEYDSPGTYEIKDGVLTHYTDDEDFPVSEVSFSFDRGTLIIDGLEFFKE